MDSTDKRKIALAKYYNKNRTLINNKHAIREAMKQYPFIENKEDYDLWRVIRSATKKMGSSVIESGADIDIERVSLFVSKYLQSINPSD